MVKQESLEPKKQCFWFHICEYCMAKWMAREQIDKCSRCSLSSLSILTREQVNRKVRRVQLGPVPSLLFEDIVG